MTLIEQYVDAKGLSWSLSTQRSELARLKAVAGIILNGPEALYKNLKERGYKPYSIKTTFIRVNQFYVWLVKNGHAKTNPYSEFIAENGHLFRNAYQKEELDVGYEEAIERINRLKCGAAKAKALDLIATGMRYTESTTEDDRSTVVGKGNKKRRVYRPDQVARATNYKGSYASFYHSLKSVGLKPHTLRKLAATNFVRNGAKEADLLKLMGWNSIATASSYLQARRDEELQQFATNSFNPVK